MYRNILLVCIALLQTILLSAQYERRKFQHLTIEDGLSQSSVFCMFQDKQGFLWIGSSNGLNQYNGYDFQLYRHDPFNKNSLSGNWILDITQDKNSNLWFATHGNGLNCYNPITKKFKHFYANANDSLEIKSNIIRTIELKSNLLYIGTNRGLNVINVQTQQYVSTFLDSLKDNSLDLYNISVNAIKFDGDSLVWLGTWGNGVLKYNTKTHKTTQYKRNKENPNSLAYNRIKSILITKKGKVIIGTFKGGLSIYNRNRNNFTNFNTTNSNINSNEILSLYEDSYQQIWVGTRNEGLFRFDIKEAVFYNYKTEKEETLGLNARWIASIFEDKSGLLWFGTDRGLSLTKAKGTPFIHFNALEITNNETDDASINSIFEDYDNNIWIGTWGSGLIKYNKTNNTFLVYKHTDTGLSDNRVWAITANRNNLFLGTGHGLSVYNLSSNLFKNYTTNKSENSIAFNNISALLYNENILYIGAWGGPACYLNTENNTFYDLEIQDRYNQPLTRLYITDFFNHKNNDTIWVGTAYNGLYFFTKQEKILKPYKPFINHSPVVGNNIQNIKQIFSNELWITTHNSGFYKYNLSNNTIKHFTQKNGLSNNSILSLAIDNNNHLWLATLNGLTKFNPYSESFVVYDKNDGLQSNEFSRGNCKINNGELIIGGVNGFNVFHPDSLTLNEHTPNVVITEFRMFNKPVNLDSILQEDSIIELKYNQNMISFEFAALDYQAPYKNKYAYKLENFDNEWNDAGARRFVTYTNLSPGSYIFRVNASNNDGKWNYNGITLYIKIIPPFYLTVWFYVIMIVLFLILIVIFIRVRERRLIEMKNLLQDKVDKRTKELLNQKNIVEKINDEMMIKNEQLHQQKEEILAQRDEISVQKEKIELNEFALKRALNNVENKNKEITSSIRYAKRIQKSILPPDNFIKKILPDSFVFYKPRDILSGDFYWIDHYPSKIKNNSEIEKIFVAAIDCTGHGVPGALLSLIGYNMLNSAVHEHHYTRPSDMLDNLNEGVITSLKKQLTEYNIKDGMDLSLISIDVKNKLVAFSGANNSAYLIRNNNLIILKANKTAIGNPQSNAIGFSNFEFQYEKNDMLYLFSDGYADQFGGPKGKKFKKKSFKHLLETIHDKNIETQKQILFETYSNWKGNLEQVDDILVIGIRL